VTISESELAALLGSAVVEVDLFEETPGTKRVTFYDFEGNGHHVGSACRG
jgi:hypothetical protein